MSSVPARLIRSTVSALGASALLATSLVATAPSPARAAEALPATLAEANAALDGNLSSLQQQASGIGGQIGDVDGQIAKLQSQNAALAAQLAEDQALVRQTLRESYIAGDPSSVEVLASNDSFSGVVGQQHYRDQVAEKVSKAVEKVEATKRQIESNIAEEQKKRDGLVALKGDLDEKIATAQAQEAAKRALAEATKNQEAEYQKLRAAEQAKEAAAAIATATTPGPGRPSQAPSAAPEPIRGNRGGNPYPWGQCTWYVYDQTGRGQNGNAGTWRPTSSTPAVGKIMIWRPGEQGARSAGHVGVVIGVNGNSVTVRHMNWNGFGVVSTGTFQSTGKFY